MLHRLLDGPATPSRKEQYIQHVTLRRQTLRLRLRERTGSGRVSLTDGDGIFIFSSGTERTKDQSCTRTHYSFACSRDLFPS